MVLSDCTLTVVLSDCTLTVVLSDCTLTVVLSDCTLTVVLSDCTLTVVLSDCTLTVVLSDCTLTVVLSDRTLTVVLSDLTLTVVLSDCTLTVVLSDCTLTVVVSDCTLTVVLSDCTLTVVSCTEIQEGSERKRLKESRIQGERPSPPPFCTLALSCWEGEGLVTGCKVGRLFIVHIYMCDSHKVGMLEHVLQSQVETEHYSCPFAHVFGGTSSHCNSAYKGHKGLKCSLQ